MKILILNFFILFNIVINSLNGQQITTADCGKTFGCFAVPASCKGLDCDALLKWKNADDKTDFTIYSKFNNFTNMWLAVGFSNNNVMGNDSVTMCKYNNSIGEVDQYYTTGKVIPTILDPEDPSHGLSEQKIERLDDFMICSFKRLKASSISPYYYNLNSPFFAFLAKGNYSTAISYHGPTNRWLSDRRFNYSSLNSNTEDVSGNCGAGFGCFRVPSTCIDESDCEYLIKWKNSETYIDFTMSTKLTNANNQYLSFGFSTNSLMGDTAVIACKFKSNNEFSIEHYYNVGRRPEYLTSSNKFIGLSDSQASVNQQILTCSTRRLKKLSESDPAHERFYDLSSEKYYLLIAKGSIDQAENLLTHGINRLASQSSIDFTSTDSTGDALTSYTLYKLHGIFMLIAWLFMSTLGVLFARYYKYLFGEKKFFGVKFWFIMHRPLMISVCIISLISLLLILIAKKWAWVDSETNLNFAHSIIGILAITFSVLQQLAFFRPDLDHPNRKYFNYGHRTGGILAYTFATIAIFLGLYIFRDNNNWSVMFGFLTWVILLVLFLEFIEYRSRSPKINPSIDLDKQKEKVNPIEEANNTYKTVLLLLHLLVSFAFLLTLIILTAI